DDIHLGLGPFADVVDHVLLGHCVHRETIIQIPVSRITTHHREVVSPDAVDVAVHAVHNRIDKHPDLFGNQTVCRREHVHQMTIGGLLHGHPVDLVLDVLDDPFLHFVLSQGTFDHGQTDLVTLDQLTQLRLTVGLRTLIQD